MMGRLLTDGGFFIIDFASFSIFDFLDDFGMPTARPGNLVTRRHDLENGIQREFYSGYLCCDGLKAQVVYLPSWVGVYY